METKGRKQPAAVQYPEMGGQKKKKFWFDRTKPNQSRDTTIISVFNYTKAKSKIITCKITKLGALPIFSLYLVMYTGPFKKMGRGRMIFTFAVLVQLFYVQFLKPFFFRVRMTMVWFGLASF